MKSIRSELPSVSALASRGCMLLFARVEEGGAREAFVAPGRFDERVDAGLAPSTAGVTMLAPFGPVERMKSAKSRVDSVSTCGSRARSPFREPAPAFRGEGRVTDLPSLVGEVLSLKKENRGIPLRLSADDRVPFDPSISIGDCRAPVPTYSRALA